MNWFQKIYAQQNPEAIIMEVVKGNLDSDAAASQLMEMNAFGPNCCEIIAALYPTNPGAQPALDMLSQNLGCQSIMQQSPVTEQQNTTPELGEIQ
jgi:hypothetical protein